MRPITIKPALNGYICTVGCQTVVFDSRDQLLSNLARYLREPEVLEKIFLQNALNPIPEQFICPDDGRRVTDRPQTMRDRELAGDLPAGTPALNRRTP